jgi:hypothetical protein
MSNDIFVILDSYISLCRVTGLMDVELNRIYCTL